MSSGPHANFTHHVLKRSRTNTGCFGKKIVIASGVCEVDKESGARLSLITGLIASPAICLFLHLDLRCGLPEF